LLCKNKKMSLKGAQASCLHSFSPRRPVPRSLGVVVVAESAETLIDKRFFTMKRIISFIRSPSLQWVFIIDIKDFAKAQLKHHLKVELQAKNPTITLRSIGDIQLFLFLLALLLKFIILNLRLNNYSPKTISLLALLIIKACLYF